MRTVLVDDDSISLFLTTKLLQREGVSGDVQTFQSSEEGLQHVLQSLPNQTPDVLLLDLNMPVLDGWGFLTALQPYEAQLQGRCAIYILTSSLAPTDASRAKGNALVTGFIHKPLDSLQVQTIYAQLTEQ